jgi:hypothetical protein
VPDTVPDESTSWSTALSILLKLHVPAGLVFLGAKGEGVNVDASVGRASGVGKAEPSK